MGDYSDEVEAAASTTLPVSVLMGTNIPRLNELLRGEDTSMVVITRSQHQCQAEQEEEEVQEEERQGVEATPVITGSKEAQEAIQQEQQDAGVFPLTNFHEDLFGPQKSRKKASRKQKRLLKQQFRQDINSEPRFPMGKLREQQNMDPCLEEVRRLAQAKQFGFFFRNGLVYRQWSPPGRCGSRFEVEQLVLPVKFSPLVMDLSHCIPLAGHLGRNKTTSRILPTVLLAYIVQGREGFL